jgi:hypothetical protein
MKLIYGITVSNEIEEVKRLLSFLKKHTKDEIVVQYDTTKASPELITSIEEYDVYTVGYPFKNDFSEFKNHLNEFCEYRDADYIFQLDADEMISEFLIKSLKAIIEINPLIDLFNVPRINTVEGITDEHIEKWEWHLNSKKWINFPDYQGRIYRPNLKWYGNVHERIVGYKINSLLPESELYCIQHHKIIERQEKQNQFYQSFNAS